jgi:hypothetical protein
LRVGIRRASEIQASANGSPAEIPAARSVGPPVRPSRPPNRNAAPEERLTTGVWDPALDRMEIEALRLVFRMPTETMVAHAYAALGGGRVPLSEIWSAAGFLIALQLGAFSWRLSREISMAESGGVTWLPLAEVLNLAALLVAVVGVFLLPIAGYASLRLPRLLLGVSLILFVGHALALVGHYELFSRGRRVGPRPWAPRQEKVVAVITICAVAVFLVVALLA